MGKRYDAFWAEFLGIETKDWDTPGISYRPHVGLIGYRGFWCFRRNERVVVSAPPNWLVRLETAFAGWDQTRLMNPSALSDALGRVVERLIGPAFQGFLARESRLEPGSETVRRLESSDERALTEFKAICTGVGWDESGLEQADDFRYAHFVGERIVAMAGFRSWREDVGDPCVLTHPSFRQRRLGSKVAKAVIADGRHHGKLMLYQTLESNDAAVHLARALGYERYASHIAVRLNNET